MKSFIAILLFFLFIAGKVDAQSVRAELNISPRPSMRLSDWSSRETAMLVIYNSTDKNIDIKIDARLSLGGAVLIITKPALMQVLSIPPGDQRHFTPPIFFRKMP